MVGCTSTNQGSGRSEMFSCVLWAYHVRHLFAMLYCYNSTGLVQQLLRRHKANFQFLVHVHFPNLHNQYSAYNHSVYTSRLNALHYGPSLSKQQQMSLISGLKYEMQQSLYIVTSNSCSHTQIIALAT